MSIICQYFAKNLPIIRVLFKRFPQTPLDVFQVQQQVLRKRLWIDNQYAINNDGLHRRSNHFAVWWTGHLRFCRTGHFHFSFIFNDGSIKLLLVNWVSEFVFRWVGLQKTQWHAKSYFELAIEIAIEIMVETTIEITIEIIIEITIEIAIEIMIETIIVLPRVGTACKYTS